MNNDIDDKLLEKIKLKIAISNYRKDINQNRGTDTLKNKEKWRIFVLKRKMIATLCVSLLLISGIAFALSNKYINKDDRGLGEGVKSAIENGYIEESKMEFAKIDDKGTEAKVENYFMDDLNLSVNFLFKFNEDVVNLENVYSIEVTDLIVRDEENRIIYAGPNPKAFEEYCEENKLNYDFGKFNENYMNCGLNSFVTKEDDFVRLTYNIYSDEFPKSKKLYISFNTITLHIMPIDDDIKYDIEGDFDIELNVPEKMYNRTAEKYKVVKCNNKDFEISTAIATDIGFEIGMSIPIKNDPEEIIIEDKISYVENEKGEKFNCTTNVSRRKEEIKIDNEHEYIYRTFDMTKYNATNTIKVVLYYYGEPVTVELERIK